MPLDTDGPPPGAGDLFGLAVAPYRHAASTSSTTATNTLNLLH